MYHVYYEKDEADYEPELIGKVDTLHEAWDLVMKDNSTPMSKYTWYPKRDSTQSYQNAYFTIPKEPISTTNPTWIEVSKTDTFFVFPGDWHEFCGERFDQFLSTLGPNMTHIQGV
jgi:hypothetical protein